MPVLEEARRLGFLGPGPVEAHLTHASGFVAALLAGGAAPPVRAADLGSGGGLPGLPLALHFGACAWLLVESSARRAAFLRAAVRSLALEPRVEVAEARAEEVGRRADARGRFDVVVARSFGPPAVVAECAAPLLGAGGRAVISEPPGGDPGRWSAPGLALLGMVPGAVVAAAGATFQVLHQQARCGARYPRRVGMPAKRPLF